MEELQMMTEEQAEAEAKRRWGPKAYAIAFIFCEVFGPEHFGCGRTFEDAFEKATRYKVDQARDN
jgi:hypothetical protein